MSDLKQHLTKVTMLQLDERLLLAGVIEQLKGRETFTDADPSLRERIYTGDIFSAILGELGGMEDSPLYPQKAIIDQLEELNEVIDSDYFQLIKI